MQCRYIFLDLILLFEFFSVSKCAVNVLKVLKIDSASGVSVFDIWNYTGVHCENENQVYRHDYIDRMDNVCVAHLDIYFRTATKYFQIRYVTPYTSFNLETVLFGAPNYMEDEGSLNRTAYPYSITMTKYNFLLTNIDDTLMHAAIYYSDSDPVSPKFDFSFNGLPYKVKMYVSTITGFSSEFTQESNWLAVEVIGAPDVYPVYGDRKNTWCPYACCTPMEYIQVGFASPIYIDKINIYETYHAGGVKKIKVKRMSLWQTVWETATVTKITSSRIFSPVFPKLDFPSNEVRIEIDQSVADDFIELDAVEIEGTVSPGYVPGDLPSDRPVTHLEVFAATMDTPGCNAKLVPLNASYYTVPDVSVPVTSVLVQYGDTAVLSCDIVSQLKLTSVTWTRNSVDIVIDNSKYEGANINTHHLTINNFQTSDYGNYVCSATTAMGEGNSGEINVYPPATTSTSSYTTEDVTSSYTTTDNNILSTSTFSHTTENSILSTSDVYTTATTEGEELCPCSCEYKERVDYWLSHDNPNHTMEEWRIILAPVLEEITKNLTLDKINLSAYLRTITSASDKRPSSKYIGVLGILLLTLFAIIIVFLDLLSIRTHIDTLRGKIKH